MEPRPWSPRTLRQGDLTAHLVGTDLRHVSWRGVEVLNRLYGAVRDEGWATICGRIEGLAVAEGRDETLVSFTSDHAVGGVPFRWEGSFRLGGDRLVATFDGVALADLRANRIGWCLLHPLSQVGGRLTHSTGGGAPSQLRIPALVAAQPVNDAGEARPCWGPFDQLVIDAQGVRTKITFTGDLFETEDQRNWTDASFKTYSTPLAVPIPHHHNAGERIHQEVTFSFCASEVTAEPPSMPAPGPVRTTWSALLREPVPAADLAALAGAVDAVRIEVPPTLEAADELVGLAQGFGRWELEVRADAATDWARLAELFGENPPECVIVLEADAVSGQPTERTGPRLHAAASAGLAGTVACVGGGTSFNFTELQRYPLGHLPLISWTFSPTVHALDEMSIRETPATYPAIVATARSLAPAATLSVGPLRDPGTMPSGWLADAFAAWRRAGVDRLCTLPVGRLVRAGQLTTDGVALARERRAG